MTTIEYARQFILKAQKLQNEHANETIIRDNFTSYLRNMFPENTKWVNYHIEGAETHIHLVRNNRPVSGFIDNCIDSTAIEYEKDLKIQSIFDEGYRQIREYTAALVQEGIAFEMILGVLSDTLNWYVYEVVPTPNLLRSEYNEDNISLRKIASLNVNSIKDRDVEDFLRFLSTYLGRQGGRSITAKRLANDFGLTSVYSEKYRLALSNYVQSKIDDAPEYYKMVEILWNKLVENHNVNTDNIDTYISEFYISIIGKILCANLICKQALSSNGKELESIINGKFFESRNIENFVDYDYFGWLNKDISEISEVLSMIQDDLKVYDFKSIPNEDMFGELMVQLATRTQRVLLGQELTPRWLSKELVNRVISQLPVSTYPKFVDMCCGSGSMIVETINATESLLPSSISFSTKTEILKNCISGFDIDPLAVILAKINWLINIYGHIDITEPVYIPIYHADSLFIENQLTKKYYFDNNEEIRLELLDKSIVMPIYIVSPDNNIFDLIVNKCYDCIHIDFSKEAFMIMIRSVIYNIVKAENIEEVSEFAYNLYRALYELNAEGKNGIWAFILKNSFRPSLISAKFNGIVSNTPWLAMSKINSNPYKEILKSIAKRIGIMPTDASFPHLEMATVFLLSSIQRYLEPNACFGCILPDSVMTGAQHKKFRKGDFKKKNIIANFNEIWELPIDTFKNRSVAIFGYKRQFKPAKSYIGRKYITKNEYENIVYNVSEVSSKSVWTSSVANNNISVNKKYDFNQGADVMPRCFFFFTNHDQGNTVQITSIKENEEYSYFLQNQKIGKDLYFYSHSIPKILLKDILVSNILLPFYLGTLPKAVLPIQKIDGIWKKLTQTTELSFQYSTLNFLNEVRNSYNSITGKSDMYNSTLNMRNKLEQQRLDTGKYLVVYGAGGANICSSYMYIDNSEKYVIDQTLYWTQVETEEEAIYLSAILNCPTLNDTISAFQPQGIFGKRHVHTLPLDYIPKFDNANIIHKTLVSKSCSLRMELISSLTPILTDPNKGTLSSRRKGIFRLLSTMPSYSAYVSLCEAILKGDNSYKLIDSLSNQQYKFYISKDESAGSLVAEPGFECYKWHSIEQDIVNIFGENSTILIGGYKSSKQLNWIMKNRLYNIRLCNRKGAIEKNNKCINEASMLLLYDISHPEYFFCFNINEHKERDREEMISLNYPNKKPGKLYMTFSISPVSTPKRLTEIKDLILTLIKSIPNHINGAPVFFEP